MLFTAWSALSGKAKIVSAIAGAIAAVAGAILAVPPAWSAIGLPEVASRGWVREIVQEPMKLAQSTTQKQVIDMQIDLANGKLDQMDSARTSLQIEKLKSNNEQIKATAETQIRKIDRDTAAITEQLRSLRSLQR